MNLPLEGLSPTVAPLRGVPMKISLEELSKLERRLHIHVPVEKVGEAFDKVC